MTAQTTHGGPPADNRVGRSDRIEVRDDALNTRHSSLKQPVREVLIPVMGLANTS
jgi:hypothetical protein